MRALRFQLKGETAFFKKPDVNVHAYFTYSHIHKIALLGLLGAVLGYGGYMQQYEANYPLGGKRKQAERLQLFPEFYEVLQKARVSIVPHGERGYFAKKIQIFNNTVGYASQEEGNILNIREQWLENPEWTIYIADDEGLPPEVFLRLSDQLLQSRCVYMPYLGKNDHPAALKDPAIVELTPAVQPRYIDSLHRTGQISYDVEGRPKPGQSLSFFREFMPIGLNEANNGYVLEPIVFTNQEIDTESYQDSDLHDLYADGERVIYFI